MENKLLDPKTGAPQWDIDYLIMDPKFKMNNALSADDLKTADKWGLPWGYRITPVTDTPMSMVLAANQEIIIITITIIRFIQWVIFGDRN